MDLAEVSKFKTKVGVIKLSEAIRMAGYGYPGSYDDCALARAYHLRTGGTLSSDARYDPGCNRYFDLAVETFGVPRHVGEEVEHRCFAGETPDQIADYVQAQGL